jgi:hypothetical protein
MRVRYRCLLGPYVAASGRPATDNRIPKSRMGQQQSVVSDIKAPFHVCGDEVSQTIPTEQAHALDCVAVQNIEQKWTQWPRSL